MPSLASNLGVGEACEGVEVQVSAWLSVRHWRRVRSVWETGFGFKLAVPFTRVRGVAVVQAAGLSRASGTFEGNRQGRPLASSEALSQVVDRVSKGR